MVYEQGYNCVRLSVTNLHTFHLTHKSTKLRISVKIISTFREIHEYLLYLQPLYIQRLISLHRSSACTMQPFAFTNYTQPNHHQRPSAVSQFPPWITLHFRSVHSQQRKNAYIHKLAPRAALKTNTYLIEFSGQQTNGWCEETTGMRIFCRPRNTQI